MSDIEFHVGDMAQIQVEFLTSDQVLFDPSGVSFMIMYPDTSRVSYVYSTDLQLIRDSIGKYHLNFPLTVSGVFTYQCKGTGSAMAVIERKFKVLPSVFS